MQKLYKNIFLVGLLSLILAIVCYLFIDKSVAVAISHIPHDNFFHRVSVTIGEWTSSQNMAYIALLIGLIGSWLTLKKNDPAVGKYAVVFLSFFITYVIVFAIKFTLARYRPELLLSQNFYGFSWLNLSHSLTSMPSGHAAANFALVLPMAIFLYKRNRLLATILVIYGITVAISRVVLNVHYVSDVLVSLTIALWVSGFLLSRVNKHS